MDSYSMWPFVTDCFHLALTVSRFILIIECILFYDLNRQNNLEKEQCCQTHIPDFKTYDKNLTSYIKVNAKCIKDPNVRIKTIKL